LGDVLVRSFRIWKNSRGTIASGLCGRLWRQSGNAARTGVLILQATLCIPWRTFGGPFAGWRGYMFRTGAEIGNRHFWSLPEELASAGNMVVGSWPRMTPPASSGAAALTSRRTSMMGNWEPCASGLMSGITRLMSVKMSGQILISERLHERLGDVEHTQNQFVRRSRITISPEVSPRLTYKHLLTYKHALT
jgi:hypothetical protein